MENNQTAIVQKDTLIDFSGLRTKAPITKKMVILIVAALLIPVLTSTLIDLSAYGEKASLALGVIVSVLTLMIGGVVGPGVGGCLICILGIWTGLLQPSNLTGSALFYQFVGLCIVGYGIEATPFGKRIAYAALKKFGSKPKLIVLGCLLISAVLSSTISNFATAVLMASITHMIMQQMGEQPGKSAFGAACMLASMVGANLGGGGFIQGSVGVNVYAVGQLQANTAGGYTITAAQWAIMGWLQLIPVLLVAWLILLACNKFLPSEINVPDPSFYQAELKKLGKIGGSEIRWLIMVVSLIVFMIMGFNTNMLMVLYVVLACFPGIGIVDARTAFSKAIPWEVVVSTATMSLIGTIFTGSGLSSWLSSLIVPLFDGASPLFFMIVMSCITTLMAMFLPGATYANIAISVSLMAPITEAMGYNPSIVMFPVILAVNYMMGLSAHATVMVSYQYGYYKTTKATQVGLLCGLAAALISCVMVYFFAPTLWGMSLYI